MNIICEECGKIYHLDPEKIKNITTDSFKTRCKICSHIIMVSLKDEAEQTPPEMDQITRQIHSVTLDRPVDEPEIGSPTDQQATGYTSYAEDAGQTGAAPPDQDFSLGEKKSWGIGLRGKMIFLFLVIPISLMGASGYISLKQMDILFNNIREECFRVVSELGEENVITTADDVAVQCKLFLNAHPDLKKEQFYQNVEFRKIASQNFGESGYTALVEMSQIDEEVRIWIHQMPDLIGVSAFMVLKEVLGEDFDQLYNLFRKVADTGKPGVYQQATGYYNWRDEEGRLRKKFMAISPIEGTPFVVLSTTYIEEFTDRIEKLDEKADAIFMSSRKIIILFLGVTLIFIGLTVAIYGHKLIRSIHYLTVAADSISVGELDTKIEIKSNDEIGELAEAIARMQASLSISIQRLRNRRG